MSEDEEYQYSEGFSEDDSNTEVASAGVPKPRRSLPVGRIATDMPTSSSQLPYQVLAPAQIRVLQDEMIKSLGEVLGSNEEVSRRLLMTHKWNKDVVMEEYFAEGADRSKQACGVMSREREPAMELTACIVCSDDLTPDNTETNGFCGHSFCKECWTSHAVVQIRDGAAGRIRCMMNGCKCFMPCNTVRGLLSVNHREDLKRFEKVLIDSFVEENPKARWCPSVPCCGNAVSIGTSSARQDCECACEEVFCFACYAPSHSPAPCEWADAWRLKLEKDAPNVLFIAANCKPCPGCHKQIAKDQGCNHMTCKCGAHFCWLCGKQTGRAHGWNSIEGHTCVTHREAASGETPAAVAARRLETYVHYLNHYDSNMKSRVLELETLKKETFVSMASAATDWEWIVLALKQLTHMRLFVSWAFVVAYNAFYGENGERIKAVEARKNGSTTFYYQTLFEDLLSKLQGSIETLSQLVASPPSMPMRERRSSSLQLIHMTHVQASNLHKFTVEEIFSRGLTSVDPAPYLPMRKIAMALGLKPVVSNVGTLTGARALPEQAAIAQSAHKSKPEGSSARSRVLDVIDLTSDDTQFRDKRKKKRGS